MPSQDIDLGTAFIVLAVGACLGALLNLWLSVQVARRWPELSLRRRRAYVTLLGFGVGLLLYFALAAWQDSP